MTDSDLLQALLDEAIDSDIHEEDCLEYLSDKGIFRHSDSRQYIINLAFNHGWKPENAISPSLRTKRNAVLSI